MKTLLLIIVLTLIIGCQKEPVKMVTLPVEQFMELYENAYNTGAMFVMNSINSMMDDGLHAWQIDYDSIKDAYTDELRGFLNEKSQSIFSIGTK